MISSQDGAAVSAPVNKKEHPGQDALGSPGPILCSAEGITDDLRDLQKCRELSNYIGYSHRLESIGIDDSIAWLRWVYPDNPPAIAQQYLERLLAGDATAEADILQIRTEVGL